MLKNSIPVGMREFCTGSNTYMILNQEVTKNIGWIWMEHLNLHILKKNWWLSTQVSCETTLFSMRSAVLLGKWDFLKEDKPCTHLFSGQPAMEVLWYSLCRAEISSGPKIGAWMALSMGMVNFYSALKGGDIGDIESKIPTTNVFGKAGMRGPGRGSVFSDSAATSLRWLKCITCTAPTQLSRWKIPRPFLGTS